ncbi:MAG: hypothetical protein WCY36_07860 [Candidatus Omnitrophota bacterium]
MKFRTTIKLTTEAKDKDEAMEIAGEYLSGNLTGGVDMKLSTEPVSYGRQGIAVALAVILMLGILTFHVSYIKQTHNSIQTPGDSAIQPPLKTSAFDKERSDFKNEWQAKQTQEALNSLKK